MARFPDAERRLFNFKICMRCNSRNPRRSTMCRKCGSNSLRNRRKEQKG